MSGAPSEFWVGGGWLRWRPTAHAGLNFIGDPNGSGEDGGFSRITGFVPGCEPMLIVKAHSGKTYKICFGPQVDELVSLEELK